MPTLTKLKMALGACTLRAVRAVLFAAVALLLDVDAARHAGPDQRRL